MHNKPVFAPYPKRVKFATAALLLCAISFFCSLSLAESEHLAFDAAAADKHKKYAILVGINQYRHYPHLNHSVADAELLSDRFENLGYTVKVLRDYEADPDIILDNLYRIGNLLEAANTLNEGTIVFAFSGHGFQQDGENFLALSKSDPTDLRRTSLPVDKVKNALSRSGIARKLMFVDACRNMPTRAFPLDTTSFLPDTTDEGLGIIYSTAPGELSFEDVKLGHGVFSYYLANALRGAGTNPNGIISLNSVFRYLQPNVSGHVFNAFDKEQFPYVAGERGGDISIGKLSDITTTDDTADQQTVASQTPSGELKSATSPSSFGWKKALAIVATIAVGAALLNDSSSEDNNGSTSDVTLVIPTP